MMLFFVSAGFITNSIQNWFNTQVETSLNESMEVAQTYYKTSAANALYYAKQISAQIRQQKLLNDENLPQLKELIRNPRTSDEARAAAQVALQKQPRDASPSRGRNRCQLTGRPRGVYRKFGLARTKIREVANRGEIPGLVKSSW